MGYMPAQAGAGHLRLLAGLGGRDHGGVQAFSRGEINELTTLIYDAREHAIGLIAHEANAIGADDVVGIKTHIHELGSLIEFMAIGTAVKRCPRWQAVSPSLPAQAIIRDKDTWISDVDTLMSAMSNRDLRVGPAPRPSATPLHTSRWRRALWRRGGLRPS